MLLHSATGVFAVRQGPWKWSEGKPTQPNQKNVRTREYTPQLYNLVDGPAEMNNLLDKPPEIAGRLEELLNRYRQQGFSRP
jgi:hypothetical protein